MTTYNELTGVRSKLDELDVRLKTLETSGRLYAAGISGSGGLVVHSGGSLTIENNGEIQVEGGGSVHVESGGDISLSGSAVMTVRDGGELLSDGPYLDTSVDGLDLPIFLGDIFSIVDGSYSGTGALVQRVGPTQADRKDAFQAFTNSANRHEIVMADNSVSSLNMYLFTVLQGTPRGLRAPYLNTLITNSESTYWPAITAGSFTTAWEGDNALSGNRLWLTVDALCSDAGTGGQVRIVVQQGATITQIGGTAAFSGTGVSIIDFGPQVVPFALNTRFTMRVEVARTTGTGSCKTKIRIAQFTS